MYKGCVLDADADVNSRGAAKPVAHERVHRPVLKAAELHIHARMDVQNGRCLCIKEAAFRPGIQRRMRLNQA